MVWRWRGAAHRAAVAGVAPGGLADPDDLDPLAIENLHIQQLVRCHSEGRTGIGVLEQLCIGPHAPSGFVALNDGAR